MLVLIENEVEFWDFDEESVERVVHETDKAFGFSSKPIIRVSHNFEDAVLGSTYLKGWFLPGRDGWFWSPLPSRVCKMWKSSTPLSEKNFAKKNYSICRAYSMMTSDPYMNSIFDSYMESVPPQWRCGPDASPEWEYKIKYCEDFEIPIATQEVWNQAYAARYFTDGFVDWQGSLARFRPVHSRRAVLINNRAIERLFMVDY